MTLGWELAVLLPIAFGASIMGAIAGGTTLITVPTMMLLGVDAAFAVGTNMFGMTFLCAGAAAKFTRERTAPRHPTLGLTALQLPGAAAGAFIVVSIDRELLQLIVAAAMIGLAAFMLLSPRYRDDDVPRAKPSAPRALAAYAACAAFAVYGGLFSGGYMTVLTVALVPLFGITLLQSVALTKIVNLVNSAVATAVFVAQGVVHYDLAIPLAATMWTGGWIGAKLAARGGSAWIRKLMVAVIVALATILAARALLG